MIASLLSADATSLLFIYLELSLHRGVPRAYFWTFIFGDVTHCASSSRDLPWSFSYKRDVYLECTPIREVYYLIEYELDSLKTAILRTACVHNN